MNLYLFNAADSAATYGIGTYLKELTRALEDADINIHIVHLHSFRPKFEIVRINQVENWYVPEVRAGSTFTGSVQRLEDYCRSVTYLLRVHIRDTKDLIFHFNFNQYQFLAKELKTVFNCKTVHTVHFMKWAFEFNGNLSRLHALKEKSENQRNSYEQLLYTTDEYESLLYQKADHIIALSSNMKELLCSEYKLDPNKISVISNGLNDTGTVSIEDREILRRKWHISEKEALILFAGRLHPVKGLLFLIRAFRKVLDKIPDCRLMIAGNGNYDAYFQETKDICTKITFTGLLEKKDLYELYQIADTGVVPSLYEPFGYVALEMMMHRLPVVATATSGLNEVIIDEDSGMKIPLIAYQDRVEIDTNLLADKIVYLLEHPKEAERLAQNARKRYEERYSTDVFRGNMLKLYNSLR